MNWLYFILALPTGFVLIRYSKWIADLTGRIETAEKYLGPTGTYTMWKIIGVGAIIFGFYALFNF